MNKFKKIYDSDNEVIGYKLGKYYLMKIWGWGNRYDWAISDEPVCTYFLVEVDKRLEQGKMYFVNSCKKGKEELLRLAKESD